MDSICHLYEQKIKMQNPNIRNVKYNVNDLHEYIDGLVDLGCLTLDPNTKSYFPHNKDWVKQRLYKHLMKLAQYEDQSAPGQTRRTNQMQF